MAATRSLSVLHLLPSRSVKTPVLVSPNQYYTLYLLSCRWQWTAFLSAGSTAGYVYFYSFYYFFFKTKMYGFFQTAFYFGYMAVFSLSLGLLCGTIGYMGTR